MPAERPAIKAGHFSSKVLKNDQTSLYFVKIKILTLRHGQRKVPKVPKVIIKLFNERATPEGKRTCKIGAHARAARAKKATVFVKKQLVDSTRNETKRQESSLDETEVT